MRPGKSFEDRFRFLLASKGLIQFFFGLMIELFIPPLGLFSPLPQFVGTVDNLFFCGCGHWGLLCCCRQRSDDRHNDEEGQRALHRSPPSWDCPAPREIPSPANTMLRPTRRFPIGRLFQNSVQTQVVDTGSTLLKAGLMELLSGPRPSSRIKGAVAFSAVYHIWKLQNARSNTGRNSRDIPYI
jgi:hypothetical protein